MTDYDVYPPPVGECSCFTGQCVLHDRPVPEGVRVFKTGATRNQDAGKLDFEGFLSPTVIRRYAEYMHQHRKQTDGSLRDSDNWQRGIPVDAYIKSLWRHVFDAWAIHRGAVPLDALDGIQDALCGVIFNAMGMLHEVMKKEGDGRCDR